MARGGVPASCLQRSIIEARIRINTRQHFYSAEKIVTAVRFMVDWGRQLVSTREGQAQNRPGE